MNNEKSKALYGFRKEGEQYIDEIGGTLLRYTYEKTDTPLVYLKRPDKNMTFAIAFRTPPADDTGVFHIIEHSVLCGSEKYPVKDPFSELLKGSVNTYLNALTYPDRTVYPVSSKNRKAFLGLVSVYMDAVLHPLALTDPDIFRQEGYRLELCDGELTESGVVYNEMQGAYASHEELGSYYTDKRLYPRCAYGYDSGGYPDAIRELSFERFTEAHKKHYHPSNAILYLDGEVSLDEILPLLDSYLSEYTRREPVGDIPLGDEPITEPVTLPYPEADTENKTQVYMAHRLPRVNKEEAFALSVLEEVLAEKNTSPLKRRILASGACNNFYCYPSTTGRHPSFKLEFRDVQDGREGELLSLYKEALCGVLAEGVDPQALRSALDVSEFKANEADYGSYPRGIVYMNPVLEAFIKGEDPAEALTHREMFARMRERIGTSYYTDLIEKYMLPGDTVSVILTPDSDLEARREEERAQRLSALFATLTKQDKARIEAECERQQLRRSTPDSAEALATLPTLRLSDIDDRVDEIINVEGVCHGVNALYHPIETSGISYLEIHFDLSDIDARDLPALSLMSLLYNEFDIGEDSALEFANKTKSTLGNLYITTAPTKRGEEISLRLAVKLSCLDSKREGAAELVRRYIYEADYHNPEMIERRVAQFNSNVDITLAENGNKFAIMRAAARYDGLSALKERLSGFEFLQAVRAISGDKDYRRRLPLIFDRIRKKYFTRQRATVIVTGKDGEAFAELIAPRLCEGEGAAEKGSFPPFPKINEGIVINSSVSYAAFMTNIITEAGEEYSGSLSTLSTLMNFELLWNEIRVSGGAYDTGMVARANSGGVGYYSYRDPCPERSARIFRDSHELIRRFLDTDTDLTKYVIGTVGASDTVTTPRQDGEYSTSCYFAGRTYEDLLRLRRQTVGTDRRELARLADILERANAGGTLCILAPREKLAELGEMIDVTLEL